MAALAPNSIRLCTLALAAALALGPPARAGDVSVKLDAGTGFSVKNSTGAVERLRVDEATGNVSRNGALFVHTTGADNLFVGPGAGNLAISGTGRNTAFGKQALATVSSGFENTAFGHQALRLSTTGGRNAAAGTYALSANTTGSFNSAFGSSAMLFNTSGRTNSAFGQSALLANTTGDQNSGFGVDALRFNATGNNNSAFGAGAMSGLPSSGSAFFNNSAFGADTLEALTSGIGNTAIGSEAMRRNQMGSRNIALGERAGFDATGNDNIYIANTGVEAENGVIRIGETGIHTQAAIAGISGATSAGGVAVLVNAQGVLGTTTSSARFKEDVRDMGEASEMLMKLRPVTFHYREDVVGKDDAKTTQYGLVAEEVAQVAPELVAPDLEGKPYSVKYHELPALLLNEIQKQERTIAAQRREIEAQRREHQQEIATLTTRLAQLETRVSGTPH